MGVLRPDEKHRKNHKQKLARVCRICGVQFKPQKHRNPAPVYTFEDSIAYLYGYDVQHDTEDIHPPSLCWKCHCALKRVQEKIRKGEAPTTMLPSKLPDFVAHGDSCNICTPSKTGRPTKKHPGLRVKPEVPTCMDDVPSTSKPYPTSTAQSSVPGSSTPQSSIPELESEEIVAEAGRHGFIHAGTKETGTLVLTKFHDINEKHMSVSIRIDIEVDRTWQLHVQSKCLSSSSPQLSSANLPDVLSRSNCTQFFWYLSHCFVCAGNVGFDSLLNARREGMETVTFRKVDNTVAAQEEVGTPIKDGGVTYTRTIRHVDCQILLPPDRKSTRCDCCTNYGHYLRSALAKIKDRPVQNISHNSSATHKHLSREQLIEKLTDAQKEKRYHKLHADKLQRRISEAINTEGSTLNDRQHNLLHHILQTSQDKIDTAFSKDSAVHFLFKQQLERSKQPDARTMRWHPLMIRWCLALYSQSPAAYKVIQDSGFLHLPHRTTLDQYSKFADPTPGFNPTILSKLAQEANLDELPEWKKNVSLIFDEMKVKSNLVFSKSSGELVGFTNLGDINEEIRSFEDRCTSNQGGTPNGPDLATHVMACMVRGLFTKLEFVFAYFPCRTFTSDQLWPVIWDATWVLTSLGFNVRAFICDGASPNRRFYRLHGNRDVVVYWAWNLHRLDQKIYFICDVPHLLKTARNNFENSGAHNRTRHLHYNKQDISWRHMEDLYDWDLGLNRQAVGLRMVPKLTHDHIYPTPSLRMKVSLAAQVLSRTVGHALAVQGKHDTVSTKKFVEMFDKFFDCLNVRNSHQGLRTRKPELEPYRDVNDVRFTWLEDQFLRFLDEWEQEAHATPHLTKDQKNRLCLSKQTLEGLRITVASFVALAKTLLQEEGVTYILSDKLNQDPLEQHFSKQRRRCGANDNPTVLEFGRNEVTLHVAGEMLAAIRGGNCGGRRDNRQIDFTNDAALPKRPRRN